MIWNNLKNNLKIKEDAAISRITITELEESLRARVKQFDELKETLKTQVAHDQKIELDGLRAENAKYESIITQKTRAVEESNEKMKLLEESLSRTRSLNEQIQADYESNLIQTESLNKQLATSKEQLTKFEGFFSLVTITVLLSK